MRKVNNLRSIISADDRLLSVDGALGEDAWHGLRRGRATVELIGLPAGARERSVGAGIVAHADISRDSVACEMAIIPYVRKGNVLIGSLQWKRALSLPAVDYLPALDGRCADCREADGEQGSDGGGGTHFGTVIKRV